MHLILLVSVLGCVTCQKGHYRHRPTLDYHLPIPFGRRMPLYQEVSLIEPRLYTSLIYKTAGLTPLPQSRSVEQHGHVVEESTSDDVVPNNANQQTNDEPNIFLTPVSEDINLIPILSYSNDMNKNGDYSYKYETSDGVTREESAVVEQFDGDSDDSSTVTRTVRGRYSYPSPDGRIISVEYIADRDGFRTTGNHLPSAKLHQTSSIIIDN